MSETKAPSGEWTASDLAFREALKSLILADVATREAAGEEEWKAATGITTMLAAALADVISSVGARADEDTGEAHRKAVSLAEPTVEFIRARIDGNFERLAKVRTAANAAGAPR